MFCEKCGSPIEEGSKFCEKCGSRVEPAATEGTAETQELKEAVQEPKVAENVGETKEPKVAEEVEAVQESKTEASKSEKPKKGGKKFIIIGAVAVVVLVLLFSSSSLAHFFMSNFASPEKYYQYIAKQQAEEVIDTYMVYYENYVLDLLSITDKSMEADVTVELGEDMQDLLGYAGVDLSWLDNVTLGVNANAKNLGISGGLELAVNKTDVLSVNAIMDCNEEEVYLQIPELNKTYLGASFSDLGIEFDDEYWEMFESISKYMPASKDLDKLLTKYAEIALECIEDVEKDKETLKAEGISQKCTALEVTIDSDTLQDMLEAVLEEMSEDKDLEDLVKKTLEVSEEFDADLDVDDAYDEFLDLIDEMLDDIDDVDMGDEEIVMTLYVNSKGEVIGSEMEMTGMTVSYAMPKQGSKFGFEYVIEYSDYYDEVKISIEGSGKESGSKLSGEFEVKVDTYSVLDVVVEDYDVDKAKKGELVGSFTISPSKSLETLLSAMGTSSYYSSYIASMLEDYSVTIDSDMDADGGSMAISVNDGKDMLVKLSVNMKEGKGSKISTPSSKNVLDLTDSDDLEDWIDDIDWDSLLDKLEDKVGVDDDYVDMLEDVIDLID